jgi:hypothetical protein
MKWIGERISFVDDKKITTIVIYPESSNFLKAIMGAWVAMWFSIGLTIMWYLSTVQTKEQELIILVIFLVFWAYYAFRVGRTYLWLLWGKELIKLDEVSLIYKKSIRKYGRAVPYYLENIRKMRVNQPKERSIQTAWEKSPWVAGGERLEFDYMGRVIRFGRKLKEKDTELLFKLLAKRLDERLRKLK